MGWFFFLRAFTVCGECKADLRLGTHQFNPPNTNAAAWRLAAPQTFIHLSSGQGGIGRVEIHPHAWGPWGEQMRERDV